MFDVLMCSMCSMRSMVKACGVGDLRSIAAGWHGWALGRLGWRDWLVGWWTGGPHQHASSRLCRLCRLATVLQYSRMARWPALVLSLG